MAERAIRSTSKTGERAGDMSGSAAAGVFVASCQGGRPWRLCRGEVAHKGQRYAWVVCHGVLPAQCGTDAASVGTMERLPFRRWDADPRALLPATEESRGTHIEDHVHRRGERRLCPTAHHRYPG